VGQVEQVVAVRFAFGFRIVLVAVALDRFAIGVSLAAFGARGWRPA
jgi:uncharacterized membrane protein